MVSCIDQSQACPQLTHAPVKEIGCLITGRMHLGCMFIRMERRVLWIGLPLYQSLCDELMTRSGQVEINLKQTTQYRFNVCGHVSIVYKVCRDILGGFNNRSGKSH